MLKKLSFKKITFFGSTEIKIWIKDDEVHYSKDYIGQGVEKTNDVVSLIKKDTFIKKLSAINIPLWKKKYEPEGFLVMDGESWTVKLESEDGKTIKCSGENDYPTDWKSFLKVLKDIVGDFD